MSNARMPISSTQPRPIGQQQADNRTNNHRQSCRRHRHGKYGTAAVNYATEYVAAKIVGTEQVSGRGWFEWIADQHLGGTKRRP